MHKGHNTKLPVFVSMWKQITELFTLFRTGFDDKTSNSPGIPTPCKVKIHNINHDFGKTSLTNSAANW